MHMTKDDKSILIDFNTYKVNREMTPYERALENSEILKLVAERIKNDNGKRYTLDDIKKHSVERLRNKEARD